MHLLASACLSVVAGIVTKLLDSLHQSDRTGTVAHPET